MACAFPVCEKAPSCKVNPFPSAVPFPGNPGIAVAFLLLSGADGFACGGAVSELDAFSTPVSAATDLSATGRGGLYPPLPAFHLEMSVPEFSLRRYLASGAWGY